MLTDSVEWLTLSKSLSREKQMTKDYFGIAERKLRERTDPYFCATRRKSLHSTDFSIISNNCWAGSVYRYYGLPYQSPTAGLYFFASDYVKFASDLRHYIASTLEFIDARDSAHVAALERKGEADKVIARLDDIEVVFLHYPTVEEARVKWERRCRRINWDNLFIKFSQMNECSAQDIEAFDAIGFPNKICFTARPMPQVKCGLYFPGFEMNNQIANDTDRFCRGFDLTAWLNSEPARYPELPSA